jgi:hypothetical protein
MVSTRYLMLVDVIQVVSEVAASMAAQDEGEAKPATGRSAMDSSSTAGAGVEDTG